MRGDEAIWLALSDPTRRRILDLLRARPRTTGDLCNRFPQSRTAVMKHLDCLERARLITIRRSGRERWNYLNATPIRRIYERWLTPFQQLWASSLSRLGSIAEGVQLVPPTKNSISLADITQLVEMDASPERVFTALTENVARWWSHVTYETQGRPALQLEPHAGGRFFEHSAKNERLYALVTRIDPPNKLTLQGAMGMSGCVFGTVAFELEARGKGTSLKMSHVVMGQVDDEQVAMYRGGWGSLLTDGLKPYVEHGKEAWEVA